jgi:hypothetical protein
MSENEIVVKKENAIVSWEEQLAKEADIAAEAEKNTGGGKFFNTRAGQLSLHKIAMPGNQMTVVMLDTIFENLYYEGKFDPNELAPPLCYAIARNEEELVPHQDVFKLGQNQNDKCQGCPKLKWGSADTGRGKACGQKRRFAVIPAGNTDMKGVFTPFEDSDDFLSSTIYYLRPPVTSVVNYADYVRRLSAVKRRPPYAVFTNIKLVPDPDNQFEMLFEFVDLVPNEFMGIINTRKDEARRDSMFALELTNNNAEQDEKPSREAQQSSGVKKTRKY